MYRLRWYRRACTRYGRQTSAFWGKQAIFELNASLSLARWRWRLLHYLKQVVSLSTTCFHVELEQFSACFRVARVCQRRLGRVFLVLDNVRSSGRRKFVHNKEQNDCFRGKPINVEFLYTVEVIKIYLRCNVMTSQKSKMTDNRYMNMVMFILSYFISQHRINGYFWRHFVHWRTLSLRKLLKIL